MNRFSRWLLALGLAVAAGAAQAETVDINLSSRAIRGELSGPLAHLFPRLKGEYNAGGLAGEKDAVNYNEAFAGLLLTGDAGARQANVTAGLGARFAMLDVEQYTGGALALGGMIEARLPAFNRIGVIGYAYGAPKVATFGDFEGYFEYAVALDYQLIREASLYAGYRQLRLNPEEGGSVTADTGFHGGIRLQF